MPESSAHVLQSAMSDECMQHLGNTPVVCVYSCVQRHNIRHWCLQYTACSCVVSRALLPACLLLYWCPRGFKHRLVVLRDVFTELWLLLHLLTPA